MQEKDIPNCEAKTIIDTQEIIEDTTDMEDTEEVVVKVNNATESEETIENATSEVIPKEDIKVKELRERNRRLQEQLLQDAEEMEQQASIQNDLDNLFGK